jgi:uncharacterized membrane protein YgaE (UPF0421/DUF939 family)
MKKMDLFKSKNGLANRIQLTPIEEEILQLFFQLISDERMKNALDAKKSNHFSKLAMLYDISQWYEKNNFVTKKQYEQLRKHILTKEFEIQAEALKKLN